MILRSTVVLALATGCANIQMGEPNVATRVMSGSHPRIQKVEPPSFHIAQDGDVVSLNTAHRCATQDVSQIGVVETREWTNATPGRDYALAGVGVAALAAGSVYLVDAGKTYSDDTSGRTYNEYGPETPRNVGLALLGVGAVALGVVVVDVIRAQGFATTERTEERVSVASPTKCQEPGPAANVPVVLRVDGRTFSLGRTDPSGHLRVDLANVLSSTTGSLPSDGKLYSGGVEVGVVSLRSIRRDHRVSRTSGLGIDANEMIKVLKGTGFELTGEPPLKDGTPRQVWEAPGGLLFEVYGDLSDPVGMAMRVPVSDAGPEVLGVFVAHLTKGGTSGCPRASREWLQERIGVVGGEREVSEFGNCSVFLNHASELYPFLNVEFRVRPK